MTRITYHCPNCGDPDGEDAMHCITIDGTYYWDVRAQKWAPSDGPDIGNNLYCTECGDIGRQYLREVELPDLPAADETPVQPSRDAILLEALELAEERLEINNCEGEEDEFLKVIRAAIAQAKGGAE